MKTTQTEPLTEQETESRTVAKNESLPQHGTKCATKDGISLTTIDNQDKSKGRPTKRGCVYKQNSNNVGTQAKQNKTELSSSRTVRCDGKKRQSAYNNHKGQSQ